MLNFFESVLLFLVFFEFLSAHFIEQKFAKYYEGKHKIQNHLFACKKKQFETYLLAKSSKFFIKFSTVNRTSESYQQVILLDGLLNSSPTLSLSDEPVSELISTSFGLAPSRMATKLSCLAKLS
jgi:hypothetical protein